MSLNSATQQQPGKEQHQQGMFNGHIQNQLSQKRFPETTPLQNSQYPIPSTSNPGIPNYSSRPTLQMLQNPAPRNTNSPVRPSASMLPPSTTTTALPGSTPRYALPGTPGLALPGSTPRSALPGMPGSSLSGRPQFNPSPNIRNQHPQHISNVSGNSSLPDRSITDCRQYPQQGTPNMATSPQQPYLQQNTHQPHLNQPNQQYSYGTSQQNSNQAAYTGNTYRNSPQNTPAAPIYNQNNVYNKANEMNSSAKNQYGDRGVHQTSSLMGRLSVEQSNTYPVNLLDQKQIVLPEKLIPPKPPLNQDLQKKNANLETMRCTLNAVPQTSSLLKQCKLPFSIYVHPFKEDMNAPVVSSVITRCRSCRSYLNPFVVIPDHKRWQCNMCYRMNDLPEELSYNNSTRQYIDVRKRQELTSATVEFIAPSEYMLRPPQPSVFVFVMDVSFNAVSTGYLSHCCSILKNNLDNLPGDCRTKIGFVTFNSSIHFYSVKATQNQPQMYRLSDLDDVFLPVPDGLLVNLKENKDMIIQLLDSLPGYFDNDYDNDCATGAALLAGRKLVTSTGGRVTLFQTCLPSVGPGSLKHRDSSNISGSAKEVQNLNPSTDFYKKLALDCASEQIGMDIFLLTGQYSDLASLSAVSRYSSGSIQFFPEFHATKNPAMLEKFEHDLKRYLTREIGFEAVMRLRCTKGLSIHTFHGNFFVRSTDLLSLPNVNPDHSFSMQIAIDEALDESNMVAFQAALLYTTTKGERRIRVHTLALPVTTKLSDIYAYTDQEAVALSLAKLAVDRSLMSSIGDAREALMNACIDCLKVYRTDASGQKSSSALLAPYHLRLLPLFVLALMKNDAFRLGGGVSLDCRVFSILEYKWQPFEDAILKIYPKLYSLADICNENEEISTVPPILNASAEKLSRTGIYLMDVGKIMYLFVGRSSPEQTIQELFNVTNITALPEKLHSLPELNNRTNKIARKFIEQLRKQRHFYSILQVIREDSQGRNKFLSKLIDDRTEASMSYHEFLQHLQRQING